MQDGAPIPSIEVLPSSRHGLITVRASGEWRIGTLEQVRFQNISDTFTKVTVEEGTDLTLDTAGSLELLKFALSLTTDRAPLELRHFKDSNAQIFRLVESTYVPSLAEEPSSETQKNKLLRAVGETTLAIGSDIAHLLSLIGQTLLETLHLLNRPRLFRFRELAVQFELSCLRAIPIISLVTFLIGVVIAYLFAVQIEKYGANIFIVDGVGIAICRELSPIIVAVVMAGRSGSAFAAQIGSMKINEEIDAIHTLGLSPIHILVIPRVLALTVSLPLLVFVGDVVGIFGGMIVAAEYLGITAITFLERLQAVMPLRHFMVGLIKAPVFAMFIAIIGCHMGLSVENNSRSLGLHTTSTVVQSIVAVILLDAAFALIFTELGI